MSVILLRNFCIYFSEDNLTEQTLAYVEESLTISSVISFC